MGRLKDHLNAGDFQLEYVSTDRNYADIFTKKNSNVLSFFRQAFMKKRECDNGMPCDAVGKVRGVLDANAY